MSLLSATSTRKLLSIRPRVQCRSYSHRQEGQTQLHEDQDGLLCPALFVMDLRDYVYVLSPVTQRQPIGGEGLGAIWK